MRRTARAKPRRTFTPEFKVQAVKLVTEQRTLGGKNIALIFEKTSTRTRCAFEVAAFDQGAHVTYLDPSGSQMGHKESIEDTARVLGRYYDGIEYRGSAQSNVEILGKHAGVPVWNGLTDEWHPTQMLADQLTMREHAGRPDQEISFFFPGTDSGTYDYMAADVVGDESEVLRDDVESSEDDNVLVQGVSGTEGAVGFFGYTYYEENQNTLKALAIDSGNGCVEPSAETAQAGEYTPLARPLFIYVNNAKYADNEAVKAYTDYYIENLAEIAEIGQFIPLSDELYSETQSALETLGS